MNFYQFLKSLQEGVGDDCRVEARPWGFMGRIFGVEVDICWGNGESDLTYKFVIPETSMANDGFLDHFCKYTIEKAQREFRIWEVGEE
jgi:hypothetical protein